jgi:hypothetical protein
MKNRIFQERKNLLFLKESVNSDLIEEMTNEQKQRTIENMIMESREILNPIEMKTLMAFTRSKLNRKENKKQIARILQVSVRQIKKIKRQGRKKLMIKPLNLLIKQSEVRMKRFYRLGKPQGQGDLDLAIILLERAYRMADLLCFLDQK